MVKVCDGSFFNTEHTITGASEREVIEKWEAFIDSGECVQLAK
jgi:hypothetical protein